ncbi:hypothetical protein MHYP_G00211680 [Metynnis hypsauchen]
MLITARQGPGSVRAQHAPFSLSKVCIRKQVPLKRFTAKSDNNESFLKCDESQQGLTFVSLFFTGGHRRKLVCPSVCLQQTN